MAEVVRFRCPVCGINRGAKHFGVNEDDEYDPEEHPAHVIERIVFDLGGRGHAEVIERGGLDLNQTLALRASVKTTLDRLDADIAEAID